MKVYRISAITLKIKDMEKSCKFYSRLPGFKLVSGGETSPFTTFEAGEGSKMYINLELSSSDDEDNRPCKTDTLSDNEANQKAMMTRRRKEDFGRIIFHSENVDALYQYMRNDDVLSSAAIFDAEPRDAAWSERFFQVIEPNGYQLSFAQLLTREKKYYCE